MSTAHKCDRCGALYADAIKNVSIESYHVVTEIKKGDAWSQGYDADLCPSCSHEFLRFIKHK